MDRGVELTLLPIDHVKNCVAFNLPRASGWCIVKYVLLDHRQSNESLSGAVHLLVRKCLVLVDSNFSRNVNEKLDVCGWNLGD